MTITLQSPLDMHLHLRDGAMLDLVAPLSAATFSGGLVMPNLVPPITTLDEVRRYRERILAACQEHLFTPYMTLFMRPFEHAFLEEIKDEITAIKLYPEGITTNAEGGVKNLEELHSTLEAMAELGIPLCVHGETHGFVMDREAEFLDVYRDLAEQYPTLKIIMEHITTAGAVALLDEYENLYATVTLHHLLITLDDVAGGLLRPHLFCKPIAKRPEDREALLDAALHAHPKLMFGSDSAPHPRHKKEACGCAAGIFTAPIALARLVELFEEHDALENLQPFVSDNARAIYHLTPVAKEITLIKESWRVPEIYGSGNETVVPYLAGEEISWRVV
ncbi:MAG: dihydroorotase [Campylobacterales bacterium]